MNKEQNISAQIKKQVHEVVPGAKVLLFGSRATNTFTAESDWDILILTQHAVDKKIKDAIYEKVFPISVQIGAFINLLVIQKNEWNTNPSYYSLRKTVDNTYIVI